MAQQKKGFITRLLEGKEKSEEYARSTLPNNRWQLFWDIFKGNFGKIVKVNLLILLFFIPVIAIFVVRWMIGESNGIIYPFGANMTIGYPAAPNQRGLAEMLAMQSDLFMYIALVIAVFIAAVGIAGGMYVIRNMVWTEGIFVANDFWRGVKLNYKNALQAALFFSIILLMTQTLINFSELSLAVSETTKAQRVFFKISQGFSYVLLVYGGFMTLWMIALGVNYTQKFGAMLRNSFLITLGTLPQTIFFAAIGALPFLLFLISSSFTMMLAIVFIVLFSFAFLFLVWLDFAQWVFDKYINPKIEGARVGRGIYNKDGSSSLDGESAAAIEYQRAILASGRSKLMARPIKPIDDDLQVYELPQSFTREDLKRLRESKENIAEDTEAYAEEHKNDLKYVEYNKQFDDREKALQEEDSKGKRGKKRKPPKMLGQ